MGGHHRSNLGRNPLIRKPPKTTQKWKFDKKNSQLSLKQSLTIVDRFIESFGRIIWQNRLKIPANLYPWLKTVKETSQTRLGQVNRWSSLWLKRTERNKRVSKMDHFTLYESFFWLPNLLWPSKIKTMEFNFNIKFWPSA